MKKQLLFNGKKGKVTRSLLTFTDPQYRFILLRAGEERSNDAVEEGIKTALSTCKLLASSLLAVSFISGTTSRTDLVIWLSDNNVRFSILLFNNVASDETMDRVGTLIISQTHRKSTTGYFKYCFRKLFLKIQNGRNLQIYHCLLSNRTVITIQQ